MGACRDVWNAALREHLEALRVARGRTMPEGCWPSRWSQNAALTQVKISKLRRRQARRRNNLAHKISAQLAAGYETVAVEQLDVAAMMAFAKGTVDKPGTNVAQKRGLNRAIASKGWGMLHTQLTYKTARAGGRRPVAEAAYTSQTCHACGHVAADSRENQAEFVCTACGSAFHADVNAAINILVGAVPTRQQPCQRPASGHAVAACQALETPVGATTQEPAGPEHAHAA